MYLLMKFYIQIRELSILLLSMDILIILVGDWSDTEKMLGNFGSRAVRKKLGNLIDAAKSEDILALKQIKVLLKFLRYRSCG